MQNTAVKAILYFLKSSVKGKTKTNNKMITYCRLPVFRYGKCICFLFQAVVVFNEYLLIVPEMLL